MKSCDWSSEDEKRFRKCWLFCWYIECVRNVLMSCLHNQIMTYFLSFQQKTMKRLNHPYGDCADAKTLSKDIYAEKFGVKYSRFVSLYMMNCFYVPDIWMNHVPMFKMLWLGSFSFVIKYYFLTLFLGVGAFSF